MTALPDVRTEAERWRRATKIIPRGQTKEEEITFTNALVWLADEDDPVGEAALIIEKLCVEFRTLLARVRPWDMPEADWQAAIEAGQAG